MKHFTDPHVRLCANFFPYFSLDTETSNMTCLEFKNLIVTWKSTWLWPQDSGMYLFSESGLFKYGMKALKSRLQRAFRPYPVGLQDVVITNPSWVCQIMTPALVMEFTALTHPRSLFLFGNLNPVLRKLNVNKMWSFCLQMTEYFMNNRYFNNLCISTQRFYSWSHTTRFHLIAQEKKCWNIKFGNFIYRKHLIKLPFALKEEVPHWRGKRD